jgi:signal transduction histidine kinase
MPTNWADIAVLLESAIGSFFYVTLLTLLMASASLWLMDKALPQRLDKRIVLGLRVLMLLRLIEAAVFGMYWYAVVPLPAAAAPLERSLHLLGIVIFTWFWTRQSEAKNYRIIMTAEFAVVLAIAAGLILPWIGSTTTFNYTDFDYLWSIACLIALALGIVQIIRAQSPDKVKGIILFAMLTTAQFVHLFLAEPFGNMPLVTEAANIVAIFFIFSLSVKEVKKEKEYYSGTESLFPAEVPVYEVPEMTEEANAPPPQSPESEELAKHTAATLRADVCVFGTLDETQSSIQIHAGYNALLDQSIKLATLRAEELPRLTESLIQDQILRLPSDQKTADRNTLVRALRLSFPGNLLVARLPNPHEQRIWFVALLRTQRAWQPRDESELGKKSTEIGKQLMTALGYLELYEPESSWEEAEPVEKGEFEESDELDSPGEFLDERQKLQEENERYKEDVARLLAHIDELKLQLPENVDASSGLVTELQQENERLKTAMDSLQVQGTLMPISPEVEMVKEELRMALEEVANLQTRLDSAQKAMVDASALQAPGRKIDENQVEVVASIAQELRQPLSSILGYTDLLLGESVGILGALQRKFLERVRNSTERMNALITDLIRIAELDEAGYTAERKPVDLSSVIDEAMGQLQEQLQKKQISLRLDLPSTLPELNTDRDALQQILYHLLQNADAATPPDGVITLRAVTDSQPEYGDFVLLQVSDTGGGIAEEHLPRIFSRVYRSTNPLISGIGDTGVGLTIAETLTHALGGRIWVESQAGVGATFSVLLPLTPHANNEEPKESSEAAPLTE